MNIIPTPTCLDLAIIWAKNAKAWLIVYRHSRDPEDLRQAKCSWAIAQRWALKASTQDGGAR